MNYSDQEILTASSNGDVSVVTESLQDHPDFFNIKDSSGLNPLQRAAKYGQVDIVKAILEKKPAKIWVKDQNRNNLLHIATMSGNFDTVSYIIEKEADLLDEDDIPMADITNKDGQTILHGAVMGKNPAVVELIYSRYPGYISSKDVAGYLPVAYAKKFSEEEAPGAAEILNFFWDKQPELFKEPLMKQFLKWGETNYDGMLAGVAEKTSRKHQKGAPFDAIVIKTEEFEPFMQAIKQRADKLTNFPHNIQFALDSGISDHWIGGDIQVKDGNIDILFFDSLADVKYIEKFVADVRHHFPDAKIRMNFDKIQSGFRPDCAIMVLSNMFHMANMDQYLLPDIPNTRSYLDAHIVSLADVEKIENDSVKAVLANTLEIAAELKVTVSKLPLRLIRDMESMSRILTRVSESQIEAISRVNQKELTFLSSLEQHTKKKLLKAPTTFACLMFLQKCIKRLISL